VNRSGPERLPRPEADVGLFSKLFGSRAPKALPVAVTDGNFVAEVTRSELPVVLDVWSPGCGPCRMLEPVVMSIAGRYAGRVKVAEMNAAAAPWATGRLGVLGTPTVVFFRRGREVERVTGFVGERYLAEIVESELLEAGEARAAP
jgi:thioredoxin-like negative regulator of GroEL